MAKKVAVPVNRIVLMSIIIGLLISFGYEPLYVIIHGIIKDMSNNSPWAELAATGFMGILYLGMLIYFFVIFVLSIFAKNVLGNLVKELRSKELLPHKFKMTKSKLFGKVYEDITTIFDSFIQMFLLVKQDKDKFSKTLERHLDPSLKKEIDERGINEIYLGGKKKNATIIFSDIRGFTAITEYHDPDIVVKILNEYFTCVTKIINANKGRVNKFIGDAIMAVFEEPPKYIDYMDADKAIIAALDMQSQFHILIKKWKKEIDPDLKIGLGVGLAKGEIVTGNIGSEDRMEYTVIGDSVNLASRLCSIADEGQVIISDDIYKIVEHLVEVDMLAAIEIKGKTGTYNIYSVKTRKMIV